MDFMESSLPSRSWHIALILGFFVPSVFFCGSCLFPRFVVPTFS